MKATRPVLLVGGDGYIGRSLCRRLIADGVEVHSLTRSSQTDLRDAPQSYGGGLENTELLLRLLPQVGCVVHMASATTPGVSQAAPSLEAQLNIAPTLALLEILQGFPDTRLVFLSSGGTVYGNPGEASATELSATRPLSFYGAGKLAIEGFLHCFAHRQANPVTILRPSNVYGPGQPLYRGFAVVRTMLQHLMDDSPMPIWGDGKVVRDFVYIDDMVDAIVRALASESEGGVYNVGSGVGHSLLALREIVESVSGRKLRVETMASRAIDVKRIVLDSSRIGEQLGWRPKVDLAEGIERTWRWLSSRPSTP